MSTVDLPLEQQAWAAEASRPLVARVLPRLAQAALVAIDAGVVLGAFLLAHWVRFVWAQDAAFALDLDQYAHMGLLVGMVVVVLFAINGMYDDHRRPAWPKRLGAIGSSTSTAVSLAFVIPAFFAEPSLSRLWLATGWGAAVAGLVIWRTFAERLYGPLQAAVGTATRVLIVGANPLGLELATELASTHQVVGYVDNGTDLPPDSPLPLLGPIAQLGGLINAYQVDELIVVLPPNRREQVSRLITRGFRRAVKVKVLTGLDDMLPQRFEVDQLAGRRYIQFAPVAAVSWIKRAVDVLLTSAGLLLISPLLLGLALAVKLDSPGPVFFRQERVGKNGHRFMIYKFRSMCLNADQRLAELRDRNQASGPLFKIHADPRITRIGKLLRRWSLDELPQLFNVLRGDMSLVGPRPPLPSEVAEYEEWQLGRLRAVPGLTGLWQVSGRSDVAFHDMVRLDLHYIRNWSLGLDVEILLRTVPAVLSNRGAY